ncbi:hypothetical protein [Streptomyces sp. NPDC086519]|uniref:hypothetical protein n=1 Tax=Streptomyces sp. NPDC086519 TaxID=3154863 RepID=UPI003447631A
MSNGYSLRWQRLAHRALGEFLAVATKKQMPALSWTIATSGALVGDVDSLATTPEKQRATFDAWAKQLDAKVTPERVTSDGVAHLYAQFAWSKDSEVRGAIRAEIYPPMDVEDGDL